MQRKSSEERKSKLLRDMSELWGRGDKNAKSNGLEKELPNYESRIANRCRRDEACPKDPLPINTAI